MERILILVERTVGGQKRRVERVLDGSQIAVTAQPLGYVLAKSVAELRQEILAEERAFRADPAPRP